MRVRFLLSSVIIAVLTAFCGGCASTPADKQADAAPQPAMRALGQPTQAPGESGDAPTADIIGSEIRRQLNADPISTAGIIVEVDGATVTLRGQAPNVAASWRAEATAHAVKGVKTVVNQIIVPPPTVTP